MAAQKKANADGLIKIVIGALLVIGGVVTAMVGGEALIAIGGSLLTVAAPLVASGGADLATARRLQQDLDALARGDKFLSKMGVFLPKLRWAIHEVYLNCDDLTSEVRAEVKEGISKIIKECDKLAQLCKEGLN